MTSAHLDMFCFSLQLNDLFFILPCDSGWIWKKRNIVRALLQHLCEGCFQQRGCHILVDAGLVGDDRGEGPDDCAAPPRSIRKTKSSFSFGPPFPTPPCCQGTRQKAECRWKCSSHLRLGQRRASLNAQDNKMQIASHPQGRLLAPTHSRRSLADQPVVVIPKEGRRGGGRGTEMEMEGR